MLSAVNSHVISDIDAEDDYFELRWWRNFSFRDCSSEYCYSFLFYNKNPRL